MKQTGDEKAVDHDREQRKAQAGKRTCVLEGCRVKLGGWKFMRE